ncbi:MAG TPA: hypothetical protein VJB16_04970, partial [archaeon]|nr:hypothetical protein [archaeon]
MQRREGRIGTQSFGQGARTIGADVVMIQTQRREGRIGTQSFGQGAHTSVTNLLTVQARHG